MTTLPEEVKNAVAKALRESRWLVPAPAVELILTAARPFLSGQGAVKKLEWHNVDAVCAWCYAKTPIGEYSVTWSFNESGQKLHYPDGTTKQFDGAGFGDRDDAKAAAQADYEARILSALEPFAARKELMKQIREGTAYGFLNDGSHQEGNPDLDCPYCGGSGHKGDVHPSAARSLALEEAAQVAEMLPECDLLSVNGNEVSPAVNDAFKRGAFAQGKAIAAAIRAISSPGHADAGKVEEDGWKPIESAPKDGTEFLGHDASTKTTHVTFANSNGYFHDPDSHYYSEAPEFNPTHWRPLPSAPASEGAE